MSQSIVILEDHPLYAAGLKEVAEQLMPDSDILCESTLSAGLQRIHMHQPLLVISDLHLPGGNGIETIRMLRAAAPDPLIIGITGDVSLLDPTEGPCEDGTLILAKTDSVDDVFDSILLQLRTHANASRGYPGTGARSNVWSIQPSGRHLTRKQQAVLSLMGQGLSNKEIARKLQISPETVKSHAKSLYRQLGVKNRTQAAGQIRRLMRA